MKKYLSLNITTNTYIFRENMHWKWVKFCKTGLLCQQKNKNKNIFISVFQDVNKIAFTINKTWCLQYTLKRIWKFRDFNVGKQTKHLLPANRHSPHQRQPKHMWKTSYMFNWKTGTIIKSQNSDKIWPDIWLQVQF